jgi:hypothetical protein
MRCIWQVKFNSTRKRGALRGALSTLVECINKLYLVSLKVDSTVGVLGPTAHPGLPLKVFLGVGRCRRL